MRDRETNTCERTLPDKIKNGKNNTGDCVGLSLDEVKSRAQRYGPNSLARPAPRSLWRGLLSQFVHFFALMLWVADALAALAGMPQLGLAIFVVIVLNGLFAFLQEHRAERATERLRDLLPMRATVLRAGTRQNIGAVELVPDDLVILNAGDRVSADLRLVRVHNLSVDSSMLTGESLPTNPEAGDSVFAGTFAIEGEAMGIVTATGSSTRLAQIARITVGTERPRTRLALELSRLVRVIAILSVLLGSIFLIAALLVGIQLRNGFLFALGVTVALVPEGLLPTITLSLAMGAQRMAARGALVRRLESVETLGSTTFICTDKTGTLTQNQMSVIEAWTPSGKVATRGVGYDPNAAIEMDPDLLPALRELALAGALYANGKAVLHEGRWTAQGNPLEAALNVFARRLGINVEAEEVATPSQQRFPFDPRRRRVSIVMKGRAVVRGAPEAVFERCREVGDAQHALAEMVQRGLRVIAIAIRELDDGEIHQACDSIEAGLRLLGLLGVEDPPRTGVADSIAACRRAGIRVAMVTGDHPGSALATAREVGLWISDDLQIEGRDLPENEDRLGALIDHDGIIISRVSPEEKLRIARALRKRGEVVAMTGDGVNDAPALHEADIGVAMSLTGTDVAREAADLVLLDDNFTTIVAAVEQGRTVFANARRFLTYHLTDNVAELTPFVIWALSGGRIPLALGVLQVLCLDVGTDILPAVALGAEPSSPRALARPPGKGHLVDRSLLLRAFCLLGVTESLFEMIAFFTTLSAGRHSTISSAGAAALSSASGAAFTAVVAGQMANAFACRSATLWPGKLGWYTNRYLVFAVICEATMLAGFLYIPQVARLLGQSPPRAEGYLTALLAIPAVLTADAIWKRRQLTSTKQ